MLSNNCNQFVKFFSIRTIVCFIQTVLGKINILKANLSLGLGGLGGGLGGRLGGHPVIITPRIVLRL